MEEFMLGRIQEILGSDAQALLSHQCKTISKDTLHLPGPDFIDRIFVGTDRSIRTLVNLQQLFGSGRLAKTGYVSILPVDQGIEHSAGASFAPNPMYFDPENIVKLAIEGGCNAVASTLGVLGSVARKYAHRIPFLMKFNHNEFLTYPNKFDQIFFASVEQARDMGAVAVGATVYFGSDQSARQIVEVSKAFQIAHYMGRAGLINSGGASGADDFNEAVKTAVINKRAGGLGLISGRKAFQWPMGEGVKLLHLIQDVYLCKDVTVA